MCALCGKDTDNPPDVDGALDLVGVAGVLLDLFGDEHREASGLNVPQRV